MPSIYISCFLVSISVFLAQAVTNGSDCFDRYGNCDIIDYKPFNSTWRVPSEAQCVELCATVHKAKCISLVYDVFQYICHMFDQDGTKDTAFLIPAFKKVFYKITDPDCLDSTTIATTTTTAAATTEATTETTQETTTVATTTTEEATTTTAEETAGECEEDKSPYFFKFPGTALESSEVQPVVYDDLDEDECKYTCELNLDINNAESVPCWSFYFIGEDDYLECGIYPDKFRPLGSVSVTDDDFSVAYQKHCLNTERVADFCEDAATFPSFRDFDIEGAFDTKTIDDLDILQCFVACVRLGDFPCRSFTYVAPDRSCVLKDVNRQDRPTQDFVAVDIPGHVYIENVCTNKKKAVKSITKTVTPEPLAPKKTKEQTKRDGKSKKTVKTEEKKSKEDSRPSGPAPPAPRKKYKVPDVILPPASSPPGLGRRFPVLDEFATDIRVGEPTKIKGDLGHPVWGDWSDCMELFSGARVRVRARPCPDGTLDCARDRYRVKPCLED